MRDRALLLVDDLPTVRQEAKALFEQRDWVVYCASDIKSAKGTFSRYGRTICAVLTDVRLVDADEHNMDGLKFAKEVRRIAPELPIIGFSAYDPPDDSGGTFSAWHRKGGGAEGLELPWVNAVETLGKEYLRRASQDEVAAVVLLKDRYGISDQDLGRLVSARSIQALVDIGKHIEASSSVLPAAALPPLVQPRLLIVHQDTESQTSSTLGKEFGLVDSFPCVVSGGNGCFIAELPGVPTFFGYGEVEQEAICTLVASLRATFDLLVTSNSGVEPAPDALGLRSFLRGLFEAAKP